MQLHNRHTIPKDINATYIGRGTIWGNPFIVQEGAYTQEQAALRYRQMLARQLAARHKGAVDRVLGLAGVEHICCSCAPRPCHGDCFVEIWDIIRDRKIKPLEGIREWVKLNGYSYGPATDGKDHINVYSKAKTRLGKFLTNMSDVPVKTKHGVFQSMEGYWYWLSTGEQHDFFKDAQCFEAKKRGRELDRITNTTMQRDIKDAMYQKLIQYPAMLELFTKSELPFTHYYFFGQDDDRTVVYPPFDWITVEWERLRNLFKGTLRKCIIAGSRTIEDLDLVKKAISDSGFEFDEVVCGEANGVDKLGKLYAQRNKLYIKSFIPDWNTHGKKAGMLRNMDMGDYADMAIVLIKDNSRGSTQMKEYMEKLGKPVFAVNI